MPLIFPPLCRETTVSRTANMSFSILVRHNDHLSVIYSRIFLQDFDYEIKKMITPHIQQFTRTTECEHAVVRELMNGLDSCSFVHFSKFISKLVIYSQDKLINILP